MNSFVIPDGVGTRRIRKGDPVFRWIENICEAVLTPKAVAHAGEEYQLWAKSSPLLPSFIKKRSARFGYTAEK